MTNYRHNKQISQ